MNGNQSTKNAQGYLGANLYGNSPKVNNMNLASPKNILVGVGIVGISYMNNGQWKLSSAGPAIVISSGLVFTGNKKPKGLSIEDVLGMIKEHPGKGYYERTIIRRVTLGDALAGEFKDLGKEKEMYSAIDLYRLQHDRVFSKTPKTGQQLLSKHYKSSPKEVKR